ncbi:acyl carrier protein [Rhodospirillaceae bacterium KN72]|uniref:Acyl carrier protein n=1 Tax=Pacificispira spongiicola TaxID=2729598 RepID=A0A7Y0DWS5_9PROT|nr:acyl carrier protein [Pacificispira spongiicola]NMM43045.1 acyl carrier protein [Pacificispira spongiicola]
MTHDQILQNLNEVFCDIFDDEDIVLTRDTTAEDIEEWDSLNQIKIILACEKKFNVRLNARDINSLENVGAMVDLLAGLNPSAS